MALFTVPVALAAGKTALGWLGTNIKWVILVGALTFSHYYAYNKGSQSVYKQQDKQVAKQVQEQVGKGVEAVRRASEDVSRIKDLESTNEKLVEKLDALDRSKCVMSDAEWMVLQEAAKQTE